MKQIIMFIIFILLWFLGIIKLNYWLVIIGSFGIGYTIASVGLKKRSSKPNTVTMTAESYYEVWVKENPKDIHSKTKFAEAYHKAKVESITDEEIDNKSEELYPYEKYMEDHLYGMHEGFKEGAKWLKSQLLK